MSVKKGIVLGAIIIAVCIIAGFLITARAAIFGDASFNEINFIGWLVSVVPTVVFFIFIFYITLKHNKDDK